MNTYWLSWYHDIDGPDFDSTTPYHSSGDSHRFESGRYVELDCICMAVDATSEDEAKAYVHGLYEAPVELEWRFCDEKHYGWGPLRDRFPYGAQSQP